MEEQVPANRFITYLLASILAISFAAPSEARALTADGFTYSVEDDAVTITGCDGTCPSNLVFPATIGGLPVVKVGWCFAHARRGMSQTQPAKRDSKRREAPARVNFA